MRLFPILILLIFIAGRTALGQSIKDTSSKKLNNAKQLNEIKIVGTKDFIEHKIDRVIINVSALLSNAGTNVIDVLNNAPGVEVIDNAITIRGKQGVTVYIDGKQSYLTGNDLYNDLQTLPSGTIDKIELMTNPPASYHVNGNAGVINIITKHNTVKGFNGNVSVSYGQGKYGKTNNALNLAYNAGKFSFYTNLGYSSINNYYDVNRVRDFTAPAYVLNQLNFERNDQQSYNYKGGINYDPDKQNSIQVSFTGLRIDYAETGNYLLQFKQYSGAIDSIAKTSSRLTQRTHNNLVNANYVHKFDNSGRDINFGLDYLDYTNPSDQRLLSSSFTANSTAPYNQYILLTDNLFNAKVYSAKADYNTPISKRAKLSTGVQFIHSNRNSSNAYTGQLSDFNFNGSYQLNALNYTETNKEAYINVAGKFKRLEAQAGLRYEYTTVNSLEIELPNQTNITTGYNYQNLIPTVYLSYLVDSVQRNTLLFSFDKRVTRPGYSSLNPSAFYFDKYTANQGNALLQPENAINFDLSFNHGNNFSVGTSYSFSRNTIVQVYDFINSLLVNTIVNVNHFSNAVLYSNLAQSFGSIWSVNVYGELSYSSYQGILANNLYLNNQIASGKVTLTNQFKLGNGWSFEATGLYRSKRTFGQGIYQPQAIANATLQKKVLNNNGTISLIARDIFHSQTVRRQIDLNQAQIFIRNENDTQVLTLNFTYRFGTTANAKINKSGLENEQHRVGL